MPPAPTIAVLCAEHRPPGMADAERFADVRYTRADDLPDALAGAEILFLWDFFSTALADAWPAADRLSWVHVASAGVDSLMFPELVASDVVVTNSRGVFERPLAEYVLGLVLAFAKDLPRTWDLQRQRTWAHRDTELVSGRRAVVVGSGPIGREIGLLLRAVGVEVTLVGRTARADDPEFGDVYPASRLVELVADADFVVSAAPLTAETHGMFDRKVFAAMPATARFVNVGRGPLVVEDDLVAALRAGQIAGAALDVFVQEPLPAEHPLWGLDGVLVSPHMGADTTGWLAALARLFVENLERWRAGAPLLNVVDKSLGYVPGR